MPGSIAAFALLLSLPLSGASVPLAAPIPIATEDESVVRIVIERPFSTTGGYAPLRVGIRNWSGRDRSWTFDFVSYAGSGTTRRSRWVLDVPSREARSFDVVVPLATPPGEMSPLNVRVTGFGIEMPYWEYPLVQYGYGHTQSDSALALSLSLYPDTALGPVQPFDAALLPTDWRGFVSLRTLVLTEEELQKASPEARTALFEWAARGGHLVRVGSDEPKSESYGLGWMVTSAVPSDSSQWVELLKAPSRPQGVPYSAWVGESVQPIETRSGLLFLFLIGYALLVGPVNLFVFCPRGKRARLFWTMPALALAASGFLTVIILLQDGLGGSGRRVTLVRLVPELTREVVVQEQVSRTGALLNRSFGIEEPVAFFDVASGAFPSRGELQSYAGNFAGNWFRSRAIQTHRLEAVRAGRARIEWAGDGRLHSAIASSLDELFYRAEDGTCWRASGVTAGSEVSLEPASARDYELFWQSLSADAGPAIREHLYASYWERGAFLARGRAPSPATVETLHGIDWEDTVIYSGRIGGNR